MTVIPTHLVPLPRDSVGRVVTYTGAWSSEQSFEVRPEPLLTGAPLAIFSTGGYGKGEPIPTVPDPSRSRKSVLLSWCQVCAEPVGTRWLGDLRIGWQTLRVDGREVPLVVDSWTCDRCLPYAIEVCPGLARRPGWQLMKVREWLPVPTPERPKTLTAKQLPYGPIGFVKIAALDFEHIDPREFVS